MVDLPGAGRDTIPCNVASLTPGQKGQFWNVSQVKHAVAASAQIVVITCLSMGSLMVIWLKQFGW